MLDHYVVALGTVIGRAGRLHIGREDDLIWVGGRVVAVPEVTAPG